MFTAWTLLDLSAGLWGELFRSETGFRRHQIRGWRQYAVKGICLTADRFAFGDLLLKSTKSKQKCMLSVGPDFVGFLHSGLAPWARAERTS
ncbi:hypothetical protein, partial [Pseudomonas syringae]